ncbi:MAG TPA: zf-TFIIB domain-containing protein [Planctomycetota bacterium]|jgi:Zn-finger nucleic acid-binding protein|nr:zf-TFIIB domain-containing protein [Planctomycetota bacterium]
MCPACSEHLVTFELEGVEIDRCVRCGGTWLDAGEFERLAGTEAGKGRIAEALYQTRGDRHGKRRCLRCPKRLEIIRVHGIELDRCPRGHGLWFDKSELETLLDSFKEGHEATVARFLGDLTAAERKKGGA